MAPPEIKRNPLVRPAARGRATAEALIDGLAPLKPRFNGVPVLNGRLAHLPAQQDDLVVDATRKVEEAGLQILHLNADGIDFGNTLLSFLR